MKRDRMKEGRRVPTTTTTSDLCSPVSKQKQRQCQCQCQQWKANTDANIQRNRAHSWMEWWKKGTWHSLNAEWVSEWVSERGKQCTEVLYIVSTGNTDGSTDCHPFSRQQAPRGEERTSHQWWASSSSQDHYCYYLNTPLQSRQTNSSSSQWLCIHWCSWGCVRHWRQQQQQHKSATTAWANEQGTHRPTDQNITNRKLTDVHRGREREREA